ncbi:hypothetical protein BCV72DRAFT_303884 [Rhizopus microsporus var. microsporus]|uniref:Uncharacterized protein n=1 Tax=Rhizopus microsporus var. microsporus TaxID=86635 RepID=A0A1X0R871_RHIZD|nr:hypothetical protein BCV72DRAFT_303884 [Rhizopus microsporus var. microsporus]
MPAEEAAETAASPLSAFKRILTIKTSLSTIGWKEQYKPALKELMNITRDGSVTGKSQLSDKTRMARSLILPYTEKYCQHASYTPIKLTNAQQITKYEGTKIHTAYINYITLHFGNQLHMEERGCSEEEIKKTIKTDVLDVCHKLKMEISAKKLPTLTANFLTETITNQIQSFLNVYPDKYNFAKNSIYYDVKAKPQQHLQAYYMLAKICEENNSKSFSCFPLRKGFIPGYMTIDAKILNYHILKNKKFAVGSKFDIWKSVGTIETDGVGVSIVKQNFDPARKGASSDRWRMITTDDSFVYAGNLSKSELLKTKDKCILIDPGRGDLLHCIHETSSPEKKSIFRYKRNQRAVEMKSRRYRKLRQILKPDYIQSLEDQLSRLPASTVKSKVFAEYLEVKAQISECLKEYYCNEDVIFGTSNCDAINDGNASDNISYADAASSKVIIGEASRSNVDSIDGIVNDGEANCASDSADVISDGAVSDEAVSDFNVDDKFDTELAIHQVKRRLKRSIDNLQFILSENKTKNKIEKHEYEWFNSILKEAQFLKVISKEEYEYHHKRAKDLSELIRSTLTPLPFRKLKLSSKINKQQSNKKLANDLKKKFGKDAVLILGDWMVNYVEFHEPIREKGMRLMLRKEGFTALLINEYKTSSFCPECEIGELETFKIMPTVKRHGLLRCKNQNCLKIQQTSRLWNRDLAAVLNFRSILQSLRETGARPERFTRYTMEDNRRKRKGTQHESNKTKKPDLIPPRLLLKAPTVQINY